MYAPRVVLVEPQNSANVGFVARLLANFDLAEWAIVGTPSRLQGEAERTGAPARETLQAAEVTPDLVAACGRCTHTLGFTARAGRHRRLVPVAELGDLREQWGDEARVALIFGREDRGLEAEECESLTALATIPTRGLSSYNLSHAVAIALHEWFRGVPIPDRPPPPPNPADPRARLDGRPPQPVRWSTAADRIRLAEKLRAELDQIGFEQPQVQVEASLRRLATLPLQSRDLRMLERALRHVQWRREHE